MTGMRQYLDLWANKSVSHMHAETSVMEQLSAREQYEQAIAPARQQYADELRRIQDAFSSQTISRDEYDAQIRALNENIARIARLETQKIDGIESSQMSQITAADRQLMARYGTLVNDYSQRGEIALEDFATWILSQPFEVRGRFFAVNNIPIPGNVPRPALINDLRSYIQRPSVIVPIPPPGKTPTLVIERGRIVTIPPETREAIEEKAGEIEFPSFVAPPRFGATSPACDAMPREEVTRMLILSEKSLEDGGEYGGVFSPDMKLSNIIEGNAVEVGIPRSADTIGTYHTHPFGSPNPSAGDVQDMFIHDDKIMCIGSTGKIGTKIKCFSPNDPTWGKFKGEYESLVADIADFNQRAQGVFHTRGKKLRAILREMSSPDYLTMVKPRTYDEAAHSASMKAANDAERISDTAEMAYKQVLKNATETDTLINDEMDRFQRTYHETQQEVMDNYNRILGIIQQAETTWAQVKEVEAKSKAAYQVAIKLREQEIELRPDPAAARNIIVETAKEGILLEKRRTEFISKIKDQIMYLGYPDKYRRQIHVGEAGWNPEELILNTCRLIWETIEGELLMES